MGVRTEEAGGVLLSDYGGARNPSIFIGFCGGERDKAGMARTFFTIAIFPDSLFADYFSACYTHMFRAENAPGEKAGGGIFFIFPVSVFADKIAGRAPRK